jgi:Glycosyltransferase family 10 (fucosyltransferase) C-term
MAFVFNMIGGGFQHEKCSSAFNVPKYVCWDTRDRSGSVSVHIDSAIFDVRPDKKKYNIAWFSESPYFTLADTLKLDNWFRKQYVLRHFDLILSCEKRLLGKHPEVKYVIPSACPWIQDRRMHAKTKGTSIIASGKNQAPGHRLRHRIIAKYGLHMDVFGRGYKEVGHKESGLCEYMFSYAIENTMVDGYFTEKVTDCLATGTIPIYWGDQTISDYFIEEGIVRFDESLDPISLDLDLYSSKLEAAKENFARAVSFPTAEDYIYTTYIS